jgi:GR25 family glycosyltransferase involved in LPS biosynthesis
METQLQKFSVTTAIRIPAINSESARVWAELSGIHKVLDIRTQNNLSTKTKTSDMDIDGWGAIGCFQSHVKAWQSVLEKKLEKAWILEDDAILTNVQNIHVSPDEPLVWLGLKGTVKTINKGRKYPELEYDRTQSGAHAYCIHSSLIPLLLKHAEEPLSLCVDFFMNEVCFLHKVYVGYYPLTKINEFLSFSDIDHFTLVKDKSTFWKNGFAVSKFFKIVCVCAFIFLILTKLLP